MHIEEHKSLKDYNTFNIQATARYFSSIGSIEDLKLALQSNIHPDIFILGGGSNMLLTKNIEALVLHINLKGIKIISEDRNSVVLNVMAGENWHEFVQYCIKNNYGGVENLSLIPGNVGTAPIQNIGAYGVELKDVFLDCNTLSIADQSEKKFTKEECKFAYRNSIFKHQKKGKYIITNVTFKLTKNNHRTIIEYGSIKQELENSNIHHPSIKDISEVIIKIRESKLPNPNEIGNSGSFFKNPTINNIEFEKFYKNFPTAPFYKLSEFEYKIPAGWLIEKSGFKGQRDGDAGVHKNQALVLVNHGNASGKEILELAEKIQTKVKQDFGILIEPEVNIV
ncbi:UDP-N-acetylmuramate dehydrogenase [Flavobacteriaceae bacterium]|nr:UDP-N-acetylmuramate dehydrogenase [Flavobacteriaceae bacterium]MDB4591368.1 UDP-N-acetylmuramate dehydrogenase [Flavobacteriaceae bacterium]MDC6468003.1 UDP-N-acetylmuramate dehydrogenase [Flavobacteriaceae bacterium]